MPSGKPGKSAEPTRIPLLSEFHPPMLISLVPLLALRSIICSRLELHLEILDLRHQLANCN